MTDDEARARGEGVGSTDDGDADGDGPDNATIPEEHEDEKGRLDLSAAAALARARVNARDRGLRPGIALSRGRGSRRRGEAVYSSSRQDGRDPVALGDQLDRLVGDRGWRDDVAVGAVIARWTATVGPEVAQHVAPRTFEDGVLTVQADSTAWATHLRFLTDGILAKIAAEAGEGVVTQLNVLGPTAPSWRRGRRSAPGGRGPRDTYG